MAAPAAGARDRDPRAKWKTRRDAVHYCCWYRLHQHQPRGGRRTRALSAGPEPFSRDLQTHEIWTCSAFCQGRAIDGRACSAPTATATATDDTLPHQHGLQLETWEFVDTVYFAAQLPQTPQTNTTHRSSITASTRYAGTRFEEQRMLHMPQKHKATIQDSTLRMEMNALEEQADNAKAREQH